MTILDGILYYEIVQPTISVSKDDISFGNSSSFVYLNPSYVKRVSIKRGYLSCTNQYSIEFYVEAKYGLPFNSFTIYATKEELPVVEVFIEKLKQYGLKVKEEESHAVKI